MTTLHVLICPENIIQDDGAERTLYVAVGLEHFIVGQGETMHEAISALESALLATLMANVEFRQEHLAGVKPAPQSYQDKFRGVANNLPSHTIQADGIEMAIESVLCPAA